MNHDAQMLRSQRRQRVNGLYAITPARLTGNALLEAVEAVVSNGASLLQYRAKPQADPRSAKAIQALCKQYSALLFINDDVDLAASIDADGVHLGRNDASVAQARARLNAGQLIGVSCYNDLNRARALAEQGADYLAFGSIYPSPTKPDAVHCPLEVISQARALHTPIVAIGGITLQSAPEIVEAGADSLAVITDVFEASDPGAVARAYADFFIDPNERPDVD